MYTGDYMKKSILKVDPFRVFIVTYSTHLTFLIKYTLYLKIYACVLFQCINSLPFSYLDCEFKNLGEKIRNK